MSTDNSAAATAAARPAPRRSYSLRLHIATLFTALILLTGLAICAYVYQQNQQLALRLAQQRFAQTSAASEASLQGLYRPSQALVRMLARFDRLSTAANLDQRLAALPLLHEGLRNNPQLLSLYAGYEDGDFVLLRRLPDVATRRAFAAPPEARYLLQSVERQASGASEGRYLFFDEALRRLGDIAVDDYRFDPRGRPWYQQARGQGRLIRTAPYPFFTTGEVGLTFAQPSADGRAVIAADLTLSRLSAQLAADRPTPSAQLALLDARGTVLAYHDASQLLVSGSNLGGGKRLARHDELPAVRALGMLAPGRPLQAQAPHQILVQGRSWLVELSALQAEADAPGFVLLAVPLDELFADARTVRDRSVLAALLILALSLPLTWWLAHRIGHQLAGITGLARQIQRFQFDGAAPASSRINEVAELGQAIHKLRETVRRFLDISQSLAAETRFEQLLDRVLHETIATAGAAGGAIYLLEKGQLQPAALHWHGEAVARDAMRPIALDDVANPLAHALQARQTELLMLAAPRDASLAYLDAGFGAQPLLLVAPPLANRSGESVGVLCLFLPADANSISPARTAFIEALSATAAVAIDNQRLLQGQKDLLDAFIKLIAGAIDAKSPYTGGHCQRVPELTLALADAAHAAQQGPWRDYQLSAEAREALHIAAWLHDCGKVTTPEAVVDKATKLETIYDRIHEVRMRFELLKRDAEIDYWRGLAQGGDARALADACLASQAGLDADFAFVAQCNLGGEAMSEAQLARLQAIGARQWRRTLDDRLGVSWEAAQRMAAETAPELPVLEPLLADKAHHRIARAPQEALAADNCWGFQLQPPPNAHDRGELHNLSVSRGTLTAEERYQINDHIVQTIIMLSRLPFPRQLARVPEMAGGHHEKMDGTGYPKRLRREDMSIEARMMAIADIFEALTAVDRPYKPGKTLSQALTIMARMRDEQHIDAELFALFLESGVYLAYAQRFLQAGQIDAVDITVFMSPAAAVE